MKYKILFKVTLFFIIFGILFYNVNNLLLTVDSMGYQNIAGFYEEREESLDAVYIGSSNCFVFWNSLLAWEEYGIAVYPYACNANLFFSTEYIIKEVRKTQPDAMFIVNINSLTDGEIQLQHMRNLIDSMPFSSNKLELIDHMSDIGDYSFSDRLEYYLPIIRFHTRWDEVTSADLPAELTGLKGTANFNAYFTISKDVTSNYVTSDTEIELAEKIVESTESLLDYCEQEDVNVLFVTVPQARTYKYQISRFNALNSLIEERGFEVLDLTEQLDDIGLDMTKDYYNGAHTNIHGSIKFTYYLAEYLIDNYDFTDKRGNEKYGDWDTDYEKYAEIISPYVLDVEIQSGVHTSLLEEPELQISHEALQIDLSWTGIDEADGYMVYRKNGSGAAWERVAETTDCYYTDSSTKEGLTYYYTVVPFLLDQGTQYYGDFCYNGISVSL